MVESPVSRHRYLYGNANPVVFEDPSGESAVAANFNPGLISQIVGILQAIPQAQAIGVGGTILGGLLANAGYSYLRGRQSGWSRWEGVMGLLAAGEPTFLFLSIGLGITPFGGGNANMGIASLSSECVAGTKITANYLLGFGSASVGFYANASMDTATAFSPLDAGLPNPSSFTGPFVFLSAGVTLRAPWINESLSRGLSLGRSGFSMGRGFGFLGGGDGFSVGYSGGVGSLIGWSQQIGSSIFRPCNPTPQSDD
jgi:hypothetical protein